MSRATSFVLLLVIAGAGFAATPPFVNYQGVLRDASDAPLSGTYDMVFHFMDAAAAGGEILTDQHAAAGAVVVSGGLFNVALGSGTVADGSGPGTYTTLDEVFRDYSAVWLEVQVGPETLSPRTPIRSTPYAFNAMALDSRPASEFIDTSTSNQVKYGQLIVNHDEGTGIVGMGETGVAGDATRTGGAFSGQESGVSAWAYSSSFVTTGVNAEGGDYGGRFFGNNLGARGVFAYGEDIGVQGVGGARGGYFGRQAAPESATLASGGLGISASGPSAGGYFATGAPWYSYTYIPYQASGILAYGSSAGGEFRSFGTSNYAYTAIGAYKILGTGVVSFVQNHPDDPAKVIVYSAPEGDEAAVYTRGSGRLVHGEAHVRLGATFALVANPDIGLTAAVTPRGEPIALAVSVLSPSDLIVRGPAGSAAEFDYMVWGLRIGFEEQSIVQPKRDESKIPSMHDHEQFFRDEPALRSYTALARYEGVEEQVRGRTQLDLSRAAKLRDAIGVFPYHEAAARPSGDVARPAAALVAPPAPTPDPVNRAEDTGAVRRARSQASAVTTAESERITAVRLVEAGVDFLAADGIVEGDVVSLLSAEPGSVVRSTGSNDTLVIGCARDREAVEPDQVTVATTQIALCRVDADYGAVAVGDRLTPSPTLGAAMRADPALANSVILGRAIEPLDGGSALIRVLVGVR